MIKRFFYGPFVSGRAGVGLLMLRLFTGIGLMMHGFPKIQNPTSWMGPDAPVPGLLQFLAAFSEFFGGLALIGGLLTPLAALGIISTMLYAALVAHAKDPIIGGPPSKELALLYFAAALTLFLSGPGTLSLDSIIFGRDRTVSDFNEPGVTV